MLLVLVLGLATFVGELAGYAISYIVGIGGFLIAAYGAWHKARASSLSRMWTALALYWVIWVATQLVYAIVVATASPGDDLTVTAADVVALMGAPALLLVALWMPVGSSAKGRQGRALLDAAILLCSVLVIFIPIVFEPRWRVEDTSLIERFFNFVFPLFSFVAVTISLAKNTKHPIGGKPASNALIAAITFIALYDASYAYFASERFSALAALVANVTIFVAMRLSALAVSTFDSDDLGQDTIDVTTVWSVLWPALLLLGAVGTVVYRTGTGQQIGFLTIVALALVLVMQALRQMTLVAENRRLARGLLGKLDDLASSEAEYRFRALHDSLTHVPNRLLLYDRIEHELHRCARDGSTCALLLIDLDGFKAVNDSFGHLVGDQVLVSTAARLTAAVRPADTVARLGGDEFAVLLENIGTVRDAEAAAIRIIDSIRVPVAVGRTQVVVGASIGIAMAGGESVVVEQLLERADYAMYNSKLNGKNRWTVWSPPSVPVVYSDY